MGNCSSCAKVVFRKDHWPRPTRILSDSSTSLLPKPDAVRSPFNTEIDLPLDSIERSRQLGESPKPKYRFGQIRKTPNSQFDSFLV